MKIPEAFYVFDLDGTLADCSHRVHHLDNKDWRAFFAACPNDKPIDHVIDVLRALVAAGHRVEIWSGRSDEVRAETETWLRFHGIPASVKLIMRTAGDHRPDEEVKTEFLGAVDRPSAIFDDRTRVVTMWRSLGIPCLQVAPGDF